MACEALRSQPSRTRSCSGGAKTFDIYTDAQCSCILLLFFPSDCRGDQGNPCQSLSNTADRVPVYINLALTSVTSATITIALQLQALLDILISEEVQHLDSFTWVGQNKGNQQLSEYLLWGRKQQTMKRNWMQYSLGNSTTDPPLHNLEWYAIL